MILLCVLPLHQAIKPYTVNVSGGQRQPSPRSALSVDPDPHFLTPRRLNTAAGSGSRYFVEHVFWLEGV